MKRESCNYLVLFATTMRGQLLLQYLKFCLNEAVIMRGLEGLCTFLRFDKHLNWWRQYSLHVTPSYP